MNLRELLSRGRRRPENPDLRLVLTNKERMPALDLPEGSKVLKYLVIPPYESRLHDKIGPGMSGYENFVRVEEERLNEEYSEREGARVLRRREVKGFNTKTGQYVLGENAALVVVSQV